MTRSRAPIVPRFRPHEHLRRPADFQAVYDRRRSAADGTLVVYARENGLQYSRVGLSVSKKFGRAVRRNRIRRLMREAFRLEMADRPAGYDLVLIPRPLDEYALAAVRHSLAKLAQQAVKKILKDADAPDPAGEAK
jgi:ribonuclease P protein component